MCSFREDKMILETLILVVWFVSGVLVATVNAIIFFVLARNWSYFMRWKKSEERIMAEGIARMVVKDITNPKFEEQKE